MKLIKIIFFILVLINGAARAQEDTKQEKGYFNIIEIGYLDGKNVLKPVGSSGENHFKFVTNAISIRNINGWFITNKISVGLGIGFDRYKVKNNYYTKDNTFLLFIDSRYYLKNKTNTFFAYGLYGPKLYAQNSIRLVGRFFT